MKRHAVSLFAAALLLLAVDARAQCRVEGIVRSSAGAPLVDATVQISGSDLRTPLSAKTDRDGRYAIKDVAAGIRVKISVFSGGHPVAVTYGLITSWVETIDIKLPPALTAPTTTGDLDPSGGASAEVRGIVRAGDGSPIAGARVSIDDTPVTIATDSAGRYSFGKLRAGLTLQLHAAAEGYETATDQVSVPESGTADMDFALGAGRPAEDGGARSALNQLSRDALFLTPLSIASDPPVTTSDGFRWYPFSRLFMNPGGSQPELLNGLPGGTAPTGSVEVSAFGTAARVSVPVGHRGSLLFGGRHSLPGALHTGVLDAFAEGTGTAVRDRAPRDSTGVFPVRSAPGFADLNARLNLTAGRNNRIAVSFYDALDEENYSRDQAAGSQSASLAIPAAFALPSDARIQAGDAQSWKGRGLSASWARDWSPGVTTSATVARSRLSKTHDQGFFLTSPLTGGDYAVPVGRETSSGLAESNAITHTTVTLDAVIRAGFRHAIDIGGEVAAIDAQAEAFTEASRRSDSAIREATSRVPLLLANTSGRAITLFAQDTWRPAGRLVVSPGVRLTHYDVTGTTYADPRVAASYPVAPRVELNAAWSIDHQLASRVLREDREHGDGDFWILADGSQVPVARVQQLAGGFRVDAPGARVDARLFYTQLDDVTLFAPRLLPGVAPTVLNRAFHFGSGTRIGLEVGVQQQSARNGLRARYTLGRAQYTYPTLEAGTFQASDDERHRLVVADWVPIRSGLSVGAAWVVAQGRPITPFQTVQQVWFPAGDLAEQAVFGARNSTRLSAYHRLDLSGQVAHRFNSVSTTLGLTVFNIYDRDNIVFNDYETVGSAASVNPVFMMHRAVNVFFKFEF